MDLVVDLVQTALQCQGEGFTLLYVYVLTCLPAFTGQQTNKLVSFASLKSIPIATSILPCGLMNLAIPYGEDKDHNSERFGDLAREFGVEAELVQALAQRLANLA